VVPVQERDEKNGIFCQKIVSEMGEGKLGFWGGIIPEEYGYFLTSILIMEEISKLRR